ncbi:MAG: putative ABC transporter permease [Clostridia bacterium]
MEEENKIFAKDYSIYKYFWIFILGCFIGYIYESILCFFQVGYIENKQGLLYGPFAPVYGFGAVLYMFAFRKIKKLPLIFLLSSLIGGFFEFIYSFIQEMFLGTISWDYSDFLINFDGRTSVFHAIFWGIIGVIFFKWIYPFISKLIEKIPIKLGKLLSYILCIFMILNFSISISASFRQYLRLNNIPAKNNFEIFLDKYYTNELLDKHYPCHKRRIK